MDGRFLQVSQSQALPEQVTSEEYNGLSDYMAVFLGFSVFTFVCLALFKAYLIEAVRNREYVAALDDDDRIPRLPPNPGKPSNPWSLHNPENVLGTIVAQKDRASENRIVKSSYPPEALRRMGLEEGGFKLGGKVSIVEEVPEEIDTRLPSRGGPIPRSYAPTGELPHIQPNVATLYPPRTHQNATEALQLGPRPPVARIGREYVTDPKVTMRSQGARPEDAREVVQSESAISQAMKSLSVPREGSPAQDSDPEPSDSAEEEKEKEDEDALAPVAVAEEPSRSFKDDDQAKQGQKRFTAMPFAGVISPKATLLQIQQQEEEEEREAEEFRQMARQIAIKRKEEQSKQEMERLRIVNDETDARVKEANAAPVDEVEAVAARYSRSEAARWRTQDLERDRVFLQQIDSALDLEAADDAMIARLLSENEGASDLARAVINSRVEQSHDPELSRAIEISREAAGSDDPTLALVLAQSQHDTMFDPMLDEIIARSREDDPDVQLERALQESQAFARAMGVIAEDEVFDEPLQDRRPPISPLPTLASATRPTPLLTLPQREGGVPVGLGSGTPGESSRPDEASSPSVGPSPDASKLPSRKESKDLEEAADDPPADDPSN
jgi:hypothetical protein